MFSRKRDKFYSLQLAALITPYMIGSVLLIFIPALGTIWLAFSKFDLVGNTEWVGLANFQRLLASDYVRISLRNSLIFLLIAVPLRLAVALFLALLMQKQGRLFGMSRAAVYLPTVIPEVSYALIWLWMFNPVYGPLNLLLGMVGLGGSVWLADPVTARLAIVIMLSFQVGEGFVIFLAALRSIPRSYFEVAGIDGASPLQAFWHITLPNIAPWILIVFMRDLVISMQNTFTPSFIMTYGGPFYSTTFVPLLVYELAFDFIDIGLASAMVVVAFLFLVFFGGLLFSRYFRAKLENV